MTPHDIEAQIALIDYDREEAVTVPDLIERKALHKAVVDLAITQALASGSTYTSVEGHVLDLIDAAPSAAPRSLSVERLAAAALAKERARDAWRASHRVVGPEVDAYEAALAEYRAALAALSAEETP